MLTFHRWRRATSARSTVSHVGLGLWLLTSWCYCCQNNAHAQSTGTDLFDRLIQQGIQVPSADWVRLPEPSLRDGQTEEEQTAALETLAGKLGWERFARDSVVAPVRIKTSYVTNAEDQRLGHLVHSAFIVYCPLDQLRNQQLMEATFGRPSQKSDGDSAGFRDLTEAELQSLDIADYDQDREGYAVMEMLLLNKIQLRGVVHMRKREADNWFQLAWEMDPRFTLATQDDLATEDDAPVLRNTWTKFSPNAVGKLQPGVPQAYQGCGGYMTVTATGRAPNQLLVESRMVLHEPAEWFAASNALRAKLPLSLQASARDFRRKLKNR